MCQWLKSEWALPLLKRKQEFCIHQISMVPEILRYSITPCKKSKAMTVYVKQYPLQIVIQKTRMFWMFKQDSMEVQMFNWKATPAIGLFCLQRVLSCCSEHCFRYLDVHFLWTHSPLLLAKNLLQLCIVIRPRKSITAVEAVSPYLLYVPNTWDYFADELGTCISFHLEQCCQSRTFEHKNIVSLNTDNCSSWFPLLDGNCCALQICKGQWCWGLRSSLHTVFETIGIHILKYSRNEGIVFIQILHVNQSSYRRKTRRV